MRAFSGRPVRPSFRDARFACLVAGEAVNSVGGWASAIVLWGFAPYRFNAGPYAVAVAIVCWAAPPAVLSPLTGVLVDRIGPRAVLIAAYAAAAGAALGLAMAGSLAELDIAAAGYGLTRALAGPAANALPPRIVAADDLLAANGLLGAAASAGQLAGPVVASAALALSGFPAAFIVDAATYLVGAAAVAAVPKGGGAAPKGRAADWIEERGSLRPERRGKEAGPAARRRKDNTGPAPRQRKEVLTRGITLVARNRTLQLVAAASAAVTFSSAAFLVVEPLYARHVLHRPASQFALFEAAAGAGGILAGLAISRVRGRLSGTRATSVSAACYGLAAGLFAGTTVVPVAYAGAFVWGVSGAVFGAVSLTTLQQAVPVVAHGRVMGVLAAVQAWVETAGLPLGAIALAAAGVRAGALILAGVAVAGGLICWSGSRRWPQLA